jgi:hypothetical protein
MLRLLTVDVHVPKVKAYEGQHLDHELNARKAEIALSTSVYRNSQD